MRPPAATIIKSSPVINESSRLLTPSLSLFIRYSLSRFPLLSIFILLSLVPFSVTQQNARSLAGSLATHDVGNPTVLGRPTILDLLRLALNYSVCAARFYLVSVSFSLLSFLR